MTKSAIDHKRLPNQLGRANKSSLAYSRLSWLGVIVVCLVVALVTLVVVFERRERAKLACRERGPIGDRWKLALSGERASLLALLTDSRSEDSLEVYDPHFHQLGMRGKAANNIFELFEKLVPIRRRKV